MTSLAKIVGDPLIKSCHRMCFCWCLGFVAGEAGFRLHFSLMFVVIESNITLGGLEDKISVFCNWIGEYGVFILRPQRGSEAEHYKNEKNAVTVVHTKFLYSFRRLVW